MMKKRKFLIGILAAISMSSVAVTATGCNFVDDMKTAIDQARCEHEWTDVEVLKEATCTADGKVEKVCSDCGATEIGVIPKVSHVWNEGKCNSCGIELTEVDITNQFVWGRTIVGFDTTNAGVYISYENNSDAYGLVHGTNANYAYTKNYVDISAYVGATLRITLPDSNKLGLVFADETATGVGATTGTKYEEGWYAYQNSGTGDGVVVDIVIPEGAKYLKTTYYWDTTDKLPFSAKIVSVTENAEN